MQQSRKSYGSHIFKLSCLYFAHNYMIFKRSLKLLKMLGAEQPKCYTTATSVNSHDSHLLIKSLLPPLDPYYHKGEAGRVGVIGGCKEYTGAPYFAAISALKIGCDLSHVFCTSDAAPVIKSYSPELIVHPILDSKNAVEEISEWLPRLHSLIIGPGLGRDERVFNAVKGILPKAMSQNIPIIIDADGLFLITKSPDIIRGYQNAILTPNAAEYCRLHHVVVGTAPPEQGSFQDVKKLCNALGNITVIQKGKEDVICDGGQGFTCTHEGSPRRCGGQGDLLSGTLGAWIIWAHHYHKKYPPNHHLTQHGPSLCAAYAACWLTKECSKRAFEKHRRSMITTNMIDEIEHVLAEIESE